MDIRASSLVNYNDCALRAAVNLFPRLFADSGYPTQPQPRAIPAVVGTGAHAAVAHMMRVKMESGSLGSVADGVEAGKAAMLKEIDDTLKTDDITPSFGAAVDQIERIARTYGGLIGYRVEPLHIEQKFRAALRDGWHLSGTVDQILRDLDLPDLKTGRRSRSYVLQLGGYRLLARSNGITPKRVGAITIARTHKSEEPARPQEVWYDGAAAERLAYHSVNNFVGDMEMFKATGDPAVFRQNANSVFCSAAYCSAFGTKACSAWTNK